MAISARDVIQDALEQLGVVAANEPLKADDLDLGWRTLKTMCGGFRREGIPIAELLSPFDNIVDEIIIDANADGIDDNLGSNQDIAEALAANLAVRLSAWYGVELDQVTVEMARRGEESMRRNALNAYMEKNPVNLEIAQIVNRGGRYDITTG